MGRRKKKGPPFIPGDLRDHALHLLDSLGFYDKDDDESNPRILLLKCISKLKGNPLVQNQGLDNVKAESLMATEEDLAALREAADEFLNVVSQERETVEDECHLVKQISQRHDGYGCWGSLADQINSSFQQQLLNEEASTRRLLASLDFLYTDVAPGPNEINIMTIPNSVCLPREEFKSAESVLLREGLLESHVLNLVSRLCSEQGTCDPIPRKQNFAFRGKGGQSTQQQTTSDLHTAPIPRQQPLSVLDLVRSWCISPHHPYAVYVQGDAGSGKSFLCDAIEDISNQGGAQVLRPAVPRDFLARSLGEAENHLIALFNAAMRQPSKSIVILDDLDVLLGHTPELGESVEVKRNHISLRIQTTIAGLLDDIKRRDPNDLAVLVVCTGSDSLTQLLARFDYVFRLEQPSDQQRADMALSSLRITDTAENKARVSLIAESLIGRSFLELSQLLREIVEECYSDGVNPSSPEWNSHVLQVLENSLKKVRPLSLRHGTADFVDMRIFTGVDLSGGQTDNSESPAGLFGDDVKHAWQEIQANVVIPLCRRRELALISGSSEDKDFCGGVLLVGPPGCGKSAIAFEAAKFAARQLPTLNLVVVSCTSLIHKEVGGSEMAVKRLFKSVREATPCILLLDGLENVGAVRGNDSTTEGSLDRVLSTLLVEMDGIESNTGQSQAGFAVIGITHNESWIDPALKRPGRLAKSVSLGLPNEEARREIINACLPSNAPDGAQSKIASQTEGMTGAAIAASCKQWVLRHAEAQT